MNLETAYKEWIDGIEQNVDRYGDSEWFYTFVIHNKITGKSRRTSEHTYMVSRNGLPKFDMLKNLDYNGLKPIDYSVIQNQIYIQCIEENNMKNENTMKTRTLMTQFNKFFQAFTGEGTEILERCGWSIFANVNTDKYIGFKVEPKKNAKPIEEVISKLNSIFPLSTTNPFVKLISRSQYAPEQKTIVIGMDKTLGSDKVVVSETQLNEMVKRQVEKILKEAKWTHEEQSYDYYINKPTVDQEALEWLCNTFDLELDTVLNVADGCGMNVEDTYSQLDYLADIHGYGFDKSNVDIYEGKTNKDQKFDDYIKANRKGNREAEKDIMGDGFRKNSKIHKSAKEYKRDKYKNHELDELRTIVGGLVESILAEQVKHKISSIHISSNKDGGHYIDFISNGVKMGPFKMSKEDVNSLNDKTNRKELALKYNRKN